eukprot:TRINITY_DN65958_c0_g1_i1.p1 TRINITY_DN65958_c0_g1~~TRINITY_DN65958_c0_g1_i1.p1  ORF type:complete len:522 (+),score=192.06 TRINITY_DN65958_c0_g1_i1:76-1641(+)
MKLPRSSVQGSAPSPSGVLTPRGGQRPGSAPSPQGAPTPGVSPVPGAECSQQGSPRRTARERYDRLGLLRRTVEESVCVSAGATSPQRKERRRRLQMELRHLEKETRREKELAEERRTSALYRALRDQEERERELQEAYAARERARGECVQTLHRGMRVGAGQWMDDDQAAAYRKKLDDRRAYSSRVVTEKALEKRNKLDTRHSLRTSRLRARDQQKEKEMQRQQQERGERWTEVLARLEHLRAKQTEEQEERRRGHAAQQLLHGERLEQLRVEKQVERLKSQAAAHERRRQRLLNRSLQASPGRASPRRPSTQPGAPPSPDAPSPGLPTHPMSPFAEYRYREMDQKVVADAEERRVRHRMEEAVRREERRREKLATLHQELQEKRKERLDRSRDRLKRVDEKQATLLHQKEELYQQKWQRLEDEAQKEAERRRQRDERCRQRLFEMELRLQDKRQRHCADLESTRQSYERMEDDRVERRERQLYKHFVGDTPPLTPTGVGARGGEAPPRADARAGGAAPD